MKLSTVLVAASAALLGGCATTSLQPCMLVGACSSVTTRAAVLQTPSRPIAALCVGKLAAPASVPIRIMAVGPAIGDGHRRAAMDNSTLIIKLYADEAADEIIKELRSTGIGASACSASTAPDTPRLTSVLQQVTTDTGGLGWKTQIDVTVDLALSAGPGNSAVWSGGFRSGNRTAVSRPDIENVKGYAANVVAELHKSGWLARK